LDCNTLSGDAISNATDERGKVAVNISRMLVLPLKIRSNILDFVNP